MEKIIDCKGMACPLPVVNAKKTAEKLITGDKLIVLVDNEIAVQNLSRFAEHKGFGVFAEKKAEKPSRKRKLPVSWICEERECWLFCPAM